MVKNIDFTSVEERKAFIESTERGLYEGVNIKGERVISGRKEKKIWKKSLILLKASKRNQSLKLEQH